MLAPSPERAPEEPDLSALKDMAQREKVLRCDAPRNSGWRPGARWARGDAGASGDRERGEVAAQIAALPAHQRPPMRMLGRASEPAEPVFRRLPAGDGVAPQRPTPVRHRHGPPIVTTIKVGSRVEVAVASPVARALGIAPGMALTQARASIPDIVVRDADPAGDAAALHALAVLMARRWTPVVAVSDADGLFLDLTGVAHLHGGEERFARRLSRLLARHGFTARIAIADTAGAASEAEYVEIGVTEHLDGELPLVDERVEAGVRVARRVHEGAVLGQGAGRHHPHDVASHHRLRAALLGLGGVLQLFADGDLVADADQPGEVALHRMDRHAGHRDVLALMLAALGQGDAERGRRDLGVLEEQLVEVAHAEEQHGFGLCSLDQQVLGHDRRSAGVGLEVGFGRVGKRRVHLARRVADRGGGLKRGRRLGAGRRRAAPWNGPQPDETVS